MGCRTTIKNRLRIKSDIIRETLAEFLGTFILVTVGNAAVAQSVLSKGANGGFLSVNWGYGLGAAFGVYVCGGISGGHINPAVTLAMCILGRTQWRKLPLYALAQVLGGFISTAVVFGIYYDGINHFDGGTRAVTGATATAGIFATYPQAHVTNVTCFFDQIVSTGLLVLMVLAITDKNNMEVKKCFIPLLVGLVIFAIGATFGYNCGYAINPARDFGPRAMTAIIGYGAETFSHRGHVYFLIPIFGPLIGGITGAWMYQLFVGLHWPVDYDITPNTTEKGDVELAAKRAQVSPHDIDVKF